MNAEAKVIIFDNLVRPTDVVGEYTEVKALQPASDPFLNANAAGTVRQVDSMDGVKDCASGSGVRLRDALRPK